MVRVYKPKPRQKPYTEDEILLAIQMVITEKQTFKDVVQHFDGKIPTQTLRDRVNMAKRGEEPKKKGQRSTLTPEVEKKLAEILGSLSLYREKKRGRYLLKRIVAQYVKETKCPNRFTNGTPGRDYRLKFEKTYEKYLIPKKNEPEVVTASATTIIKKVVAELRQAANSTNDTESIADNSLMPVEIIPMRRTRGDSSRIVSVDTPEITEDHGADMSKANKAGTTATKKVAAKRPVKTNKTKNGKKTKIRNLIDKEETSGDLKDKVYKELALSQVKNLRINLEKTKYWKDNPVSTDATLGLCEYACGIPTGEGVYGYDIEIDNGEEDYPVSNPEQETTNDEKDIAEENDPVNPESDGETMNCDDHIDQSQYEVSGNTTDENYGNTEYLEDSRLISIIKVDDTVITDESQNLSEATQNESEVSATSNCTIKQEEAEYAWVDFIRLLKSQVPSESQGIKVLKMKLFIDNEWFNLSVKLNEEEIKKLDSHISNKPN